MMIGQISLYPGPQIVSDAYRTSVWKQEPVSMLEYEQLL